MKSRLTFRSSPSSGAWATGLTVTAVAAVALAYVAAVAHGVMTIDVARDLFWGIEIATGRAWPLIGPPVGAFELLSATWYYIAASAVRLSASLSVYFGLLGALAALKFVLIYRVGLRWRDARFALTLVVAATLPGVVSYQFFGVSHTQMVEASLWATALFALRLRAVPQSAADAIALGVCAALSLHAHPTAILLLPWAAWAVVTLPMRHRVRAALISLAAALVVFAPFLLALALRVPAASENIAAATALRGSMAGLLSLVQNLFWFQPTYVVETLGVMGWGVTAWLSLWALLLIVSAAGAWAAATAPGLRATFWATLATLAWVLVAVTWLRDHTPFYMLYVALPPMTVLYGLAWTALGRFAGGNAGWVAGRLIILTVVVAMHVAACWGYVRMANDGMVVSRLPLHSNMQNTATSTHVESASAAPTRDAVARWLCGQNNAVALHGDLAATFDMGLGQEQFFHCRNQRPFAATGGALNAWTGLPLPVWRELAFAPKVVLGTYGLVQASTVVSPAQSLPQVSGRAYPPRFALMISAAGHPAWTTRFRAPADALIVVSSLMPTYPQFSVSATLAADVQPPVAQFANTFIFRCARCAASPTALNWQIVVSGGAPETTSITVLNAEAASASLAP